MSRVYQYEFVVDQESRKVSFATFSSNNYRLIKDVAEARDALGVFGDLKIVNKEFNDKFGLTPTKFKKIWNAIQRKVWVEPVEKYVMRFGFNSQGKVCGRRLENIWSALPLIEQAEKDNTENIIPFLIERGMDTQQLKKLYGKSVWKKLCANSMTRNKYLARVTDELGYVHVYGDRAKIESLNKMPSFMLKKGGRNPYGWGEFGLHCYKLFGKDNLREMRRYQDISRDCKRMADQLGKNFDPIKYNYEKTLEKHAHFKEQIMLKQYSPEPFAWMKDCVKVVEYKGYKAELLDNALAVRLEGEKMHHCVGLYSGYCKEGKYQVWHVSKDGKPSSTIGIELKPKMSKFTTNDQQVPEFGSESWNIQQHYGVCNAHIECADEKEIAIIVLNIVNKEKLNVQRIYVE